MIEQGKAMRYREVLLDADDTLFDFRAAERAALFAVLQQYGHRANEDMLAIYIRINEALWKALEKDEITKEGLKTLRFSRFFAALAASRDPGQQEAGRALEKVDPAAFGEEFLSRLAEGSQLMPGALEVCRTLSASCRLSIVTNGITRVQEKRLAGSSLKPYIAHLFISEAIGSPKPQPAFFAAVFRCLGINAAAEKAGTIIVGDSLTSDMAGGFGAGIDTCWYTPEQGGVMAELNRQGAMPMAEWPEKQPVTYRIRHLTELIPIIQGGV